MYYCQVNFLLQLLLPRYLRGHEVSGKAKSRNGGSGLRTKWEGLRPNHRRYVQGTSYSLLAARLKVFASA
jgi:hypothetical protein